MTNPIYVYMHCDGTYMFIYIYPLTCIQPHLFKTINKDMSPANLIANIQIWIIGSCIY